MTTLGGRSKRLGTLLALATGASGLALFAPTAPAVSDDTTPPRASAGQGEFLAPAYLEGDLDGDGQVTPTDLEIVGEALGTTDADPGWAEVAAADLDGDLTITVGDLALVSQGVLFDDGSFDLVEATALDMQEAMNAGVVTSVELTQAYLDRIAAYDATVVDPAATGRALNSIIATSDVALEAAAASDAARAENGGPSGMLDGIPVLLKDNYNTSDMPTTAGCGCWNLNQTTDDAFMVEGLREAGAIILGKASMDEFAFGFVSEFSALSEPGSSKLVASPYFTDRTAGGSSGGTGASIAANLGAIGFGTDTGGSIRVPSTYNQLVGIRPTVGAASRDGIVPLALSQDTGGPLARTVTDAAVALDAVVGTDANDPATAEADAEVPETYTSYLDPDALEGKRFGYLPEMVPPATATNAGQLAARRLFLQAVADLEAQGAVVEEITIDGIGAILGEASGSGTEFDHDLDAYAAAYLDADVPHRDLLAIAASGHTVPSRVGTYGTRGSVTQEQYDAWMASHTAVLESGQELVTGAMDEGDLDALIYPSGTPYGTYSTNMRLSPNTGMPSVTVPMGQTVAEDGVAMGAGAGVNLEFLGRDFAEGELIGAAYAFEQATAHRTTPALYPALEGDTFPGPGDDADEPGDGSVSVAPSKAKVAAGERFTVTVTQDAADLFAFGLDVGYDPAAVRYVAGSAEAGTTGTVVEETGTGSVSIAHTRLGTSPAAQGATDLVTLTFRALKPGKADIEVTGLVTSDATGATTETGEAVGADVKVVKASTATVAKLRSTEVPAGRKARLTVTVTSATLTPTGKVSVKVGRKVVVRGARLIDGRAALSFPVTGTGRKDVTVTYLPTSRFAGSKDRVTLRVTR